MKKILCAAAALSLIGSAAFADISVTGRGKVEVNAFNYSKPDNGDGTTKLFSDWETDDSDVFVSGDWGFAGAMLNIDFEALDGHTNSWIGDWNVWIKPLDFMTIKASNEANRVANRYNTIIDKLESKWGVLTDYAGSYQDDDSFKGYQVNFDFNVVKLDLGFNKDIQKNSFSALYAMNYGKDSSDMGFGARVVVPVEGLLNVDALFKMAMTSDDNNKANEATGMTFGAIVDIVAIDNMGLAIGYIGHSGKKWDTDTYLQSAVDVRFQYNMDKMGFALHNNATFGKIAVLDAANFGSDVVLIKTNLGFLYSLTDSVNFYAEVQNMLDMSNSDIVKDKITVYPRFQFAFGESNALLKTGLKAGFGVSNDDSLDIALPISMEVFF